MYLHGDICVVENGPKYSPFELSGGLEQSLLCTGDRVCMPFWQHFLLLFLRDFRDLAMTNLLFHSRVRKMETFSTDRFTKMIYKTSNRIATAWLTKTNGSAYIIAALAKQLNFTGTIMLRMRACKRRKIENKNCQLNKPKQTAQNLFYGKNSTHQAHTVGRHIDLC